MLQILTRFDKEEYTCKEERHNPKGCMRYKLNDNNNKLQILIWPDGLRDTDRLEKYAGDPENIISSSTRSIIEIQCLWLDY